MNESLVQLALNLLKKHPEYIEDAKIGALVSNSIVGSVLSLTTKSPRSATEAAVREALNRL